MVGVSICSGDRSASQRPGLLFITSDTTLTKRLASLHHVPKKNLPKMEGCKKSSGSHLQDMARHEVASLFSLAAPLDVKALIARSLFFAGAAKLKGATSAPRFAQSVRWLCADA